MKADLIKKYAITLYNKFLQSGRPLYKSEYPDIDKQYFTYLIKFLLPIFAPIEDIYLSYSSKINQNNALTGLRQKRGYCGGG